MSIKRKLIAIMLAISGISVALTVGAILLYITYDIRQSKQEELEISASISGSRNAAAIVFLDSEMATKNLAIYEQDNNILLACLYDESGDLFAFHHKAGKTTLKCPENKSQPLIIGKNIFTAWRPVLKQSDIVGDILLVSDSEEINAYIRKIITISILVTLLVFPLIFAITIYLQRTIANPIAALTNTVQSITSSGNYGLRTTIGKYSGEIAILAKSFNKMIEEIQTKAEALQQINRTLEDKVRERTLDLEKAMHRAESANQAKTEFLRNMSHEFRTPLHAIVSFSAYGVAEAETAERNILQQYFANIEKGGNRLIKLVNEVLNVARLEKGEYGFNMQYGQFSNVIENCLQTLEPLAKQKAIKFKISNKIADDSAVFDCERMIQLVTNIIGNAIKFSPNDSTISISLTHVTINNTQPAIEVVISDEGMGIPNDELSQIFDAFVQSSRTNNGSGGTGLGLAICRGIIQAHNGEIEAFNNEDKGASFVFRFPTNLAEGEILHVNAA